MWSFGQELVMKMMMAPKKKKNEEQIWGRGLIDIVFSWTIPDIMNKELFMNKVEKITETFSSTDHYLKSFIDPLIEETHADLFSSLRNVSRAPICEVKDVKLSRDFELPCDLFYSISINNVKVNEHSEVHKPETGDLIALTDVQPKCIDDLNRPKRPYVVAVIQSLKYDDPNIVFILSSKLVEFEKEEKGSNEKGDGLYAVYLTNLTTNIRIWRALNADLETANMKIVTNILQVAPDAIETCALCPIQRREEILAQSRNTIRNFGLDYAQESAVLNCISSKDCFHQNTVKLVWGPPGTGKTKTVASLLVALSQMRCRTLTCAPTNIAVLGVAKRLMSLIRPTLKFDTYGLGDIVLFGNGKQMKIDDYEELFDVFLDYRVRALSACFAPLLGWKGSAESMINLLEDPEKQYELYLANITENEGEDDDENDGDEEDKEEKRIFMSMDQKAIWKKTVLETVEENKKKSSKDRMASQNSKCNKGVNNSAASKKSRIDSNIEGTKFWSFEEFIMRKINSVGEKLLFCTTSLYTHLPTKLIREEVVTQMFGAVKLFKALGRLFRGLAVVNEGLREALHEPKTDNKRSKCGIEQHITSIKRECLEILKFLQENISLPNFTSHDEIKTFCLQNACLIFCTASSSIKLQTGAMTPFDLLIIDEAAQLKECESTIALQLPGLCHAILIGDEKQLPAMVQSKICEEAGFGRSLFERLVGLGHQKDLLNIQYRMHPLISLFPNKMFYGKQIMDGPNVRERFYNKRFLEGQMFGPYSFINVTSGKEQFDGRHSRKNVMEVYVVAEIIAKLHKESLASKQRIRVGCISPYKAQVFAIQKELGKTYSTDAESDFSVNARSVDGFQGGEEDIIIISTVRCNGNGSVGFLSDHQRTNVALTRARYCLWILGNSTALTNSGSVWAKLVMDAKDRGCFYNAKDDKNLATAISGALVQLGQFDKVFSIDKSARWKVCFNDAFFKSLKRIQDFEICKKVVSIVEQLSSGWRQPQKAKLENGIHGTYSVLLEVYEVNKLLKLIWTVDIQRENSIEFQVIKVWDVLPSSEVPKLARHLDILFGNYTMNTINRCKFKQMEGNLVVPMKWTVAPVTRSGHFDDPTGKLVSHLSKMSLKDEERPSTSIRLGGGRNHKKVQGQRMKKSNE